MLKSNRKSFVSLSCAPVAQDDIRFLLAQDDNSLLKQISEKGLKLQQPLLKPET
jgi:hypothetical protein